MSKRPPHKPSTEKSLKATRMLENIGFVILIFYFLAAVHVVVNVMPYDMENFLTTAFEAVEEIFVS